MRIPETPPALATLIPLLAQMDAPDRVIDARRPVDAKGRYLHWDELRRRTPPDGLTHDQWWLATALARNVLARPLPLTSVGGEPFTYCNVDSIQEMVHSIDQQASGHILADEVVTGLRSSKRYLVSSLVEEAITSSQLEGASTTRRVAKELIQSGRKPRDRSEQMILNNYEVMQVAADLAASDGPLTPADVIEMHRIVSAGTLDDERDEGRLQSPGEERIAVVWPDGTVLHRPPPADVLPQRLQQMCDFANGHIAEAGFTHPVVRAIILHFWLAYDHPFVDGNGRTARALFYWSMLRSRYWLTSYISISRILHMAPARYARSYLFVETSNSDVTYFILHQLDVIQRAVQSLHDYLARKMSEARAVGRLLRGRSELNHRQVAIVSAGLQDHLEAFTINAHARSHGVTYQTARTDLLGLVALELFTKDRIGRRFVFWPVSDLAERIRS